MTKIRHAKVTRADVRYGAEGTEKAGDDYAILTLRVRNGLKERVETFNSNDVTYGPDGDEAEKFYSIKNDSDISGVILPGKSKSGVDAFLIPKKYQSDVVLEATIDFEHEPAVFSGSVK